MLNRIFDWLKFSKPRRMNLRGQYYAKNDYDQTANYANSNISISGVKELLAQLESGYKNYLQEMGAIVNDEATAEEEKYTQWEKISKIKNICKYSAMALLLFIIICIAIQSELSAVGIILIMLDIIVGGVLKIIDVIYEKKYRSYDKSISDKFSSINIRYANLFNRIYQDIDSLYLGSLDPAHREVILMRRDQERQHQEAMRANAQQAEIQQQLAEEQRRARIAQEELLQIEKERERRYNRY